MQYDDVINDKDYVGLQDRSHRPVNK